MQTVLSFLHDKSVMQIHWCVIENISTGFRKPYFGSSIIMISYMSGYYSCARYTEIRTMKAKIAINDKWI